MRCYFFLYVRHIFETATEQKVLRLGGYIRQKMVYTFVKFFIRNNIVLYRFYFYK